MSAGEAERDRAAEEARRTLGIVRAMKDEFVDFLSSLARVESPTSHPETIRGVHAVIGPALQELGYEVRVITGKVSGDHLLARPKGRVSGVPTQLLVGHTDTVWPLQTLERMPVRVVEDRLHGPGTLDMKGGLTMMLFALRALKKLGREPEVTPVLFMNADEEVGEPRLQALGSAGWPRRRAEH